MSYEPSPDFDEVWAFSGDFLLKHYEPLFRGLWKVSLWEHEPCKKDFWVKENLLISLIVYGQWTDGQTINRLKDDRQVERREMDRR